MNVQEEEILSGGDVQVVLYFHLELQGKLHHQYLTYAVSLLLRSNAASAFTLWRKIHTLNKVVCLQSQ